MLWKGKLTDKMTPSSLDNHLRYTMRWFNGMTLKLTQSYWTSSLMFSAFAPYSITASSTEGGSVSDEGKKSVWWKNDKTYTITPDKYYKISQVIVDGVDIGPVSEHTFSEVRADHTIHAVFERTQSKLIYASNIDDSQRVEQTIDNGNIQVVDENTFTYPNHRFVG